MRNGHTLLEVLVSSGILLTLLSALGLGLSVSISAYRQGTETAKVEQSARAIIGSLSRDMGQATAEEGAPLVPIPEPGTRTGPEVAFYIPNDLSDMRRIKTERVRYFLSGGTLFRETHQEDGSSRQRSVAGGVRSFSIEPLDSRSFRVTFSLTTWQGQEIVRQSLLMAGGKD
ncbi:MAG: hypothetical protein HYU64_11540 [Armatimonadetes bacterium]|nr:hypothetical protein [Armatimonadota bacterium]